MNSVGSRCSSRALFVLWFNTASSSAGNLALRNYELTIRKYHTPRLQMIDEEVLMSSRSINEDCREQVVVVDHTAGAT